VARDDLGGQTHLPAGGDGGGAPRAPARRTWYVMPLPGACAASMLLVMNQVAC